MRRLVHFPVLRHDQQQPAAASQGPRDLLQHTSRFAHVLQRHDVKAGIEALIPEREGMEVGDRIQAAVVPICIA